MSSTFGVTGRLSRSARGGPGVADGAPASPHAALLSALASQRGDIVGALTAATLGHADYAAMDGRPAADVRATVAWVFDTFVACAGEPRGLLAEEIERLEGVGLARAAEGVPLEAVIERFTHAYEFCYRRLRAASGPAPDPGMAAAFDDLALALHRVRDAAVAAIRRGYERAAGAGPSLAASPAALVEAVLHPGVADQRLAHLASQVRWDTAGHCALVVVAPADGAAASGLPRAVDRVGAALPGAAQAAPRWGPLPHGVLLLPGRWNPSPEQQAAIGVACRADAVAVAATEAPVHRLGDLGDTYRRLRPLLHVAEAVTGATHRLCLQRLAVYQTLAEVPFDKAEAFVREALGPVLALPARTAEDRLRLLAALHAEGGEVTAAARTAGIARATAYVWLDAVLDRTGLDARDPFDFERLVVALRLLHLHRPALPPLGDPSWAP